MTWSGARYKGGRGKGPHLGRGPFPSAHRHQTTMRRTTLRQGRSANIRRQRVGITVSVQIAIGIRP
jgi:hypothetical protein